MLQGSVLPLLASAITGAIAAYWIEAWLLQKDAFSFSFIVFILVISLVILIALFVSRVWQDREIESKVRTVLPNLSRSQSSILIYMQSLIAAYKASHTELRNYQKIIEQQKNQSLMRDDLLNAVLGGLDVPLIILDQDATIIEFNAEAERLFGYERSYALAKNPVELPLLELLTTIYTKGWNTQITAHAPDLLKQPIKTLGQNRRGMKISCKTIIQQLEHKDSRLFVVRVYSTVLNASNTGFIDPKSSAIN